MTQTTGAIRPGRTRAIHAVKAETIKLVTLRSTAITLVLTVVVALLVTGLAAHSEGHHSHGYYLGFDPTQLSLSGLIVAGLTGGVFGALLVTGEYASGTIRATLAALPRRAALLAAKTGVTVVATLVFCALLSFACFFLGQAVLARGGAPSATLVTPGALRAVVMTGVFIGLMALMSFGFGLVFRSTAAAIAAFVGVVFVLPIVMHSISESDVRYLPTNILTNSIMATVSQGPGGNGQAVSPAIGLSLMALYAATSIAIGAVLFVTRDA